MTKILFFGIRSSSCLNKNGLFTKEQISLVKDAGFDLLELNLNHQSSGLDYNKTDFILQLNREAERISVRLTAHAPAEISMTSPEKSDDGTIIKTYSDMIRKTAGCGIGRMVAHPCINDRDRRPGSEEKQMERFMYRMEKIAAVCETEKAVLLLETMVPGRISSSMDNLIRVVDAVNSPFLKICLDTNHLNLSEDICCAMGRAGDRIGEFHLNDNHGAMEEHLLPWSGIIDWNFFAESVRTISYNGDMVFEPSILKDGTPYKPEHTDRMLKETRDVADRILNAISSKDGAGNE